MPPSEAVTLVSDVGPEGRDITLWLFATGFSELAGIHARCTWPGTWRVDGIEEVRTGQLYAHESAWTHARREIVTAFECLDVSDQALVVGRIDLHLDRPGQIRLEDGDSYLEVIDCQIRPRVIRGVRGSDGGRSESRESAGVAMSGPSLVRRSAAASRDGARFDVVIDSPSKVTARIYDVMGRSVRTINQAESFGAGTHSIVWNGTSDNGKTVASGIYVLRVHVAGRSLTERVVIIR